MLPRDAPASCQALAPDPDVTQLVDHIKIVWLSVVIFKALRKQHEQLLVDYTPHGVQL